jgi:hypothetical protein
MHEVQLNQSLQKTIVTFHANMLEYFYATPPPEFRGFHVRHIKSIEITTDTKGKHTLVLTTDHAKYREEVDENALGRLNELVAEVQHAIQEVSS